MSSSKEYQKYDWEGIQFPLGLSQVQSVTNHYDLPFDTELTIWRNDEYRLEGIIKGIVDNKDAIEYKENGEVKETGFIEGEILRAKTNNNDEYLIEGFGIKNVNVFKALKDNQVQIGFICEVYISSIKLINNAETKPDIICEWYLCSMPTVLFSRTTKRYDVHPNYKFRSGLEIEIQDEDKFFQTGHSSSWDYALIQYDHYQIVLQQVPEVYLPEGTDGIVIEYRTVNSNFPTTKFRKLFRE